MDKFSLVFHPHTLQDYIRMFPAFGYLPEHLLNRINRFFPPFLLTQIKGVSSSWAQMEGELFCCPLTSQQLRDLSPEVSTAKIVSTVKRAQRNGAKLVGLGGLTAAVGDRGVTIAQETGVAVTTGLSYTVYAALEGITEAAKLMEIDFSHADIVILGADCTIGHVCTRILAEKCRYVTLAATPKNRLEKLATKILYETGLAVKVTGNIKTALRHADMVIAVTPALAALPEAEDLKPGAVLYHIARSQALLPDTTNSRNDSVSPRNDVLCIEAEAIAVPGQLEANYESGFPHGQCSTLMAEVMLLTLEKRFESYSLGWDVTRQQVEEIGSLAQKHGFKVAGLRHHGQNLAYSEIERVKKNARMKQLGLIRVG